MRRCSLCRSGSPWGGGYGADSPRHPLVELLRPPGAAAIGGAAAGHRRARATQATPTPGAAHWGFREGGEGEDVVEDTKKCPRCGETKLRDQFRPPKGRVFPYCRPCEKAYRQRKKEPEPA